MKRVKVAVTGAAGQIGYALVFRIASGEMFGQDTEVDIHLLELEAALPALQGVVMELEDCAFPLLKSIVPTADLSLAFREVDWALLVGSVPRKAGMERKELLTINGNIFIKQGEALARTAKPSCRVLVVGNPCNTNAYIAKTKAGPRIPERNFFAMTMLDQHRAVAQLAKRQAWVLIRSKISPYGEIIPPRSIRISFMPPFKENQHGKLLKTSNGLRVRLLKSSKSGEQRLSRRAGCLRPLQLRRQLSIRYGI